MFKLCIDQDYGTKLKTGNTGRHGRRKQKFRCPSKNFNKPKSFKLRSIKSTNLYKPYNNKFANRIYNNLYIKSSLKSVYDFDE